MVQGSREQVFNSTNFIKIIMNKETIQEELNTLRRSIELLEVNQVNSSREPTLREFVAWLDLKPDLGENLEFRDVADNINKLLKAFLCLEGEGRLLESTK
jgi:hypothetical protein